MSKATHIKVAILEDNKFFNDLLSKRIENYMNDLSEDKKISFEIQSFTTSYDFIKNMKQNTDVALIDYYLDDVLTGVDILKKIKQDFEDCKVIIISRANTLKTSVVALLEGASNFIVKDKNALDKTCFIIEDIINAKLKGLQA